jgi:tRNA-splicing ligase RtcB
MRTLVDQHPDQKIPILSWADSIEPGALQQAVNLASLPVAVRHVAIMPDVHVGYGMPIGGVLATEDVVVPNAVGVDIGCGMRSIKTGLHASEVKPKLDTLLAQILSTIPTGFKHHRDKQRSDLFRTSPDVPIIRNELESAKTQIGTLGGGNHFIELQKDQQDRVWIMIHSGSRNFGYKTAQEYATRAKQWCARNQIVLPDQDLAFLPIDAEWGQEYLAAMQYAQDFARANRGMMMQTIVKLLEVQFPNHAGEYGNEIDVHHNYAVWEEHFGKRVLVHRKGAVNADKGVKIIVPGSMGTISYIGRGLGDAESFRTAAHGAGRRMGRKEALRKIPAQQVWREMQESGVALWKEKRSDVAEECKQAYKDIDEVMEQQKDLVKIEIKLEPMGVVKG